MAHQHPILVCFLLLYVPFNLQAQTTLYNETLGNFPADQGWFLYLTNSPPDASQSYVPTQGTRLITINNAMAGYFNKNPITGSFVNPAFPPLDRSAGFRISWDLLITSETHASNDRAGFSIIALASDNRGIELGFWTNEIWAQNDAPIFTHGEGVAFSTTTRTHFDLNLLGNNYDLHANGISILTGSVRNYTAFGLPYTNSNFLFLGDDTSSANADITLGRVTMMASIPEPATWLSLACIAFGLACYWKTRKTEFSRV